MHDINESVSDVSRVVESLIRGRREDHPCRDSVVSAQPEWCRRKRPRGEMAEGKTCFTTDNLMLKKQRGNVLAGTG